MQLEGENMAMIKLPFKSIAKGIHWKMIGGKVLGI